MSLRSIVAAIFLLCALQGQTSQANAAPAPSPYIAQADEVMAYVQKTFWDPKTNVYIRAANDRKPDYIWRQAAAFSALVGGARYEPDKYRPLMVRHFAGMNSYWDAKAPIPGYEPGPTKGNGHDKYYDDNAWLIITFADAFRVTGEKQYLTRADETAQFVASGWDDQLGGGIWWHASHKDGTKNTCANGPAAVGFLALARLEPNEAEHWRTLAAKDVDWTLSHLQASDGLFEDRVVVATGEVKKGKLTYNSALMLRACLDLYQQTKKPQYLAQAKRIGKAADALLYKETGVYRDPLKWSHFMVEADLALYRQTGEAYLLARAKTNADAYYAFWQKQHPDDMMSNVATARILWLMADTESETGRAFWKVKSE
ncbi:MAG TPA: glycoside hydrolase family 76 protein [Tepidisphaeraceae bacterium]|jgi:hypothetical protein|nr:glycoside hydrolase family 76 protein [Tepidisphaeraceae bacterium]